jgi:translation initiation factor IF-3
VNEQIRAPMVRVVDEDGNQVGIITVADALKMARERDLDLVQVAANARPPVCRIMDYGKYKYEFSKRQRKAKQKSHQTHLKEVKMGVKIGDHDLQTKLNKAREFLEKRDKVKFTVRFRGREIVHKELGEDLLRKAQAELEDVAMVEVPIRLEGRFLSMMVAPKPSS